MTSPPTRLKKKSELLGLFISLLRAAEKGLRICHPVLQGPAINVRDVGRRNR
jgi:hypothetical protein